MPTLAAIDFAEEILTALTMAGKVRRLPHIGGGIVVYAKAVGSTLPECEKIKTFQFLPVEYIQKAFEADEQWGFSLIQQYIR